MNVSWINLDEDLIKIDKGCHKGKFDWKKSIGCTVRFLNDGEEKTITIIDYMRDNKKDRLTVEFKEREFNISTTNFTKCKLKKIIELNTKEYIYSINQEVNELIITDRNRIVNNKGFYQKSYKYICKKCGFNSSNNHYKNGVLNKELWISEYNIKSGNGCSCCAGKIVVPEINSIWKTHKYMIEKFGISEYDSKRYTYNSGKKVSVTCPNCKKVKNIQISSIYTNNSIGCTCSDGISYPEKFMISMLNQLGVEFETQYSPKWEGLKKMKTKQSRAYDFCLCNKDTIIETHGIQHYEQSNRGRSLIEEQKNDKEKEKIALQNGIKNYIVIDCRKSELNWIKNSILNSKLSNMFDLSDVDWDKCDFFASNNLKIEVCNYKKMNENSSVTLISKIFNVSRQTIIEYLKWGNLNGYCKYCTKESRIKAVSQNGKLNGKQVEIFKDGISLGVFESAMELSRQSENLFGVKLSNSNISSVCNGKYAYDTYKGYSFKYV